MVQKGPTTGFRSIHFRLVVAGEAGAVVALQSGLEPRDKKKSFPHFLLVSFGKKRDKANGEPHKWASKKKQKGGGYSVEHWSLMWKSRGAQLLVSDHTQKHTHTHTLRLWIPLSCKRWLEHQPKWTKSSVLETERKTDGEQMKLKKEEICKKFRETGGNHSVTLAARRVHYLEAESRRINPNQPSYHAPFLDCVATKRQK